MSSLRLQPVSCASDLAGRFPPPFYQHTQHQSPLFSRLPGEIRNRIYTQVFTTTSAELSASPSSSSPSSPPHPLSLLLTCRRIHQEAAIPAFATHTFPLLDTDTTYLALQKRTSRLQPVHLRAITSLRISNHANAPTTLVNALLVFPALSSFSITIPWPLGSMHYARGRSDSTPQYPSQSTPPDPAAQAAARYAPQTLTHILHTATSGTPYAWQTGARWRITWPQADDSLCYSKIVFQGGQVTEELVMDSSAVGAVDGVGKCGCRCDVVVWTQAVLVQEGGRRVRVSIVYLEERKVGVGKRRDEEVTQGVVLVPGVACAGSVMQERRGFRYEADEEYWEALRRRNGNLGAWWRGVCAKTMAFENESYSRLTGQKKQGRKDATWV